MPLIPENTQKEKLHQYLANLARQFSRDSFFEIDDLYTCGGTCRRMVGDEVRLPRENAIRFLRDISKKGLIEIKENDRFTFCITGNYDGLPDLYSPSDIFKEKISILSNQLQTSYTVSYAKLSLAERKLISAENDSDYSEIGNLCVQFWEDFTEELWSKFIPATDQKPAKKKIKDKLSPIIKRYTVSARSQNFADALWDLFDQARDLNEKVKHRSEVGDNTDYEREAKNAILLTAFLAEEILYNILLAGDKEKKLG